jgi:precorrin-6A/cobalt-precorrin-6A reductase
MTISAASNARRLAGDSPSGPSSPKPRIVSHLPVTTGPTLLILGGTTEARALAEKVSEAGVPSIYSYAGRTAEPVTLPIPTRIGGFGGEDGLATYLRQTGITHVIDATHPFAEIISRNAVNACARAGVPLIGFTRPAWEPEDGDTWINAPDLHVAVAALDTEPQRIFLAIGRKEIGLFATKPQHFYLLRLVDAPKTPPPFPNHEVVVAKGPFDAGEDLALLREHRIGLIVAKNSGGDGARAKIVAARKLGVPILMIDRPALPDRHETHVLGEVLEWISHTGTDRGV